MAVATMRVGEFLAKNADKLSSGPSGSKPAPSLLPSAGVAGVAPERVLSAHGSRSGSPNSRATSSRGSSITRLEEPGSVQPENEEGAGPDGARPEPAAASRASAPHVTLDSCPSFAEQSCKPLWLDRHATLQRAYSETLRAKGDDENDDEQDCLGRVDEVDNDKEPVALLQKYLPTWDVAKSGVWLLAEAAVKSQLRSQSPDGADGDAHSGLASVAEEPDTNTTTVTTTSTTSASTPALASATSSGHGSTPVTSCSSIPESASAAATASQALQPPLTQRHTAPPPPPSFQRLATALRRARSTGRASLVAPLGLGNALGLSPSTFETGRSICAAALHGGGAAAAIAAAGGGAAAIAAGGGGSAIDGLAELHSHGGRHHVAFAAGLAAATSAAAAVSQGASIAAGGLSAAASAGSAASLALELGGKALSAGGGVLVDKVQGVVARHATAAVADLILGPSSSAAARELLVKRVQATVAGASIAWFLLNLMTMSDSLAHLDFEHDFSTSVKLVLDLVTSGPSLMENCKDLAHIGVLVGLRVAQRNTGGGGGGGGGGMGGGVPSAFEA